MLECVVSKALCVSERDVSSRHCMSDHVVSKQLFGLTKGVSERDVSKALRVREHRVKTCLLDDAL